MIATIDEPGVKHAEAKALESILLLMPVNVQQQTAQQYNLFKQDVLKKAARQITKFRGIQQHSFITRLEEKLAEISNDKPAQAKSVAIYISEEEEQLQYSNYAFKAKLLINQGFNIITILRESNSHLNNYLAVILTGCYASIYFSKGKGLKKVITLTQENGPAPGEDTTSLQKCHLSSSLAMKKQMLGRSLQNIDEALNSLIQTHPLPIFVFGSHSAAHFFTENSAHRLHIIELFTSNYTNMNEEFISSLVALWGKHNLHNEATLQA